MSSAAARCIVCLCLCAILLSCFGAGSAVRDSPTADVAHTKLLEDKFQAEDVIPVQKKPEWSSRKVAEYMPAGYHFLTSQRQSAQQSSTYEHASSALPWSLRDASPHRHLPPTDEPGKIYDERNFLRNSQLLVKEPGGRHCVPAPCRVKRRKRAFDLEIETRAAWSDPEGALTRAAEWFVRKLWMPIQELAGNGTLSSKCVSGLLSVYSGVKHGQLWALKFLDATGKFPSGVLTALSPSSDPGSYDECLSIGHRDSTGSLARGGQEPARMAGRYCTVLWVASAASLVSKLSDNEGSWNDTNSVKRIRQGVCVPSHCSGSELEALIEKVFIGSSTTATVSACRSTNDLTLTHAQLAVICIFIVWITLVAFSTLLHFYWDRKETSSKEIADSCHRRLTVALSAVTSIKRLLLVREEKHMAAVQPLKTVSLVWIILGMTYRSRLLEHGEHEVEKEWQRGILYTLAASSDLAYTTVLLISGYCAANTVLELHRLKVSYIRRLLAVICLKNRLTMSAVFTLGAFLLYPLFVDGPGADRVLPRLSAACQRQWGFVFVHLNNLRGHENVCYHPLWYISCEMQIFTALSGIVVLIRRFKRTTSVLLAFIALVAVAAVSAIVGVRGYQPPIVVNSRESARTLSDVIYLPFLHAPAFIIGVLFNHWITRVRRVSVTKCMRVILWLLSASALVWGAFYPCLWKSWVPSPTAAASVLFVVGLRLAWCAAIAFVLWAATAWKAGLVHDVLGCRTVAALGRLSLGAYLCSWMIAMHGVLSARHPPEAGQAFMVRDFVANMMISYVAALLFYVACDGPAQSLCSLLRTLVIGREAARRRRSFDECDRKVRFLSELLGLEAPRCAKELPHQQHASRTLQRMSSLKDMVLHL